MHLLSPISFNEVIPLEHTLDSEIIFLIALIQQRLLNDSQLGLEYPKQTRIARGDTNLGPYLKVPVEENLLPDSPPDVHPP